MQNGYLAPLYILPFDHRNSYVKDVFGFDPPLTDAQQKRVEDSKQVIYEGFLQALEPVEDEENKEAVDKTGAGILVDEEFGTAILQDAHRRNIITALSVEKSGSDEFFFEYGEAFAEHIERFDPTFAKVLVRYNPDSDADMNRRQAARLKQLSDYCRDTQRPLMFELLAPATDEQLARVLGNKDDYDTQLRPGLMCQAIDALQKAGVEPAVWKIEGLDRTEDCEKIVAVARREGRDHVSCIVLGRGADDQKVVHWLTTAASVEGFIGFAVGRTSFLNAVTDYVAGRVKRAEAVRTIATQYASWIRTFTQARDKAAV